METFKKRLQLFSGESSFILFIFGLVVVFSFYRSVISITVNDEGHALAFFHRLQQGDFKSVREVNEIFSYLLLPIYNTANFFVPISDHFVLFSQLLYWFACLATGFFVFYILKNYFRPSDAFLVGLLFPAYTYYFPVLFYSNLALVFFTFALFLNFNSNLHPKPSITVIGFTGFLLSLAAISHPGGMVLGSCSLLVCLRVTQFRPWRFYIALIFSAVATGLIFILLTGLSISDFLISSRHWLLHSKTNGIPISGHKVLSLLHWLYTSTPIYWHISIIIPFIFFVLLIRDRKLAGTFLAWFFIPLIYLLQLRGIGHPGGRIYSPGPIGGGGGLIRYLTCWAPIFLFFLRKNKRHRTLFSLVWIPSVSAAIGMAFTSNTGPGNLNIGFLPAFMVSVVFLIDIIKQLNPSIERFSPILLGSMIIILLAFNFSNINLTELAKSSVSPFKGVYVTKDVSLFAESLNNALKTIPADKEGRILIQCTPGFLGGYSYLFSSQKPGLRQTFGCQLGEKLCSEFQLPYNREITTIANFKPCSLPIEFHSIFKKTSEVDGIEIYERIN